MGLSRLTFAATVLWVPLFSTAISFLIALQYCYLPGDWAYDYECKCEQKTDEPWFCS